MHFCPEKLKEVRETLNINKAEAARKLNISAMAYGRYEKGEREPSYQTVCFIANAFHCNIDFLYGLSDRMDTDYIIVSRTESPELYNLLVEINKNDDIKKRIMAYAQKLTKAVKPISFMVLRHSYLSYLLILSYPHQRIPVRSGMYRNLRFHEEGRLLIYYSVFFYPA